MRIKATLILLAVVTVCVANGCWPWSPTGPSELRPVELPTRPPAGSSPLEPPLHEDGTRAIVMEASFRDFGAINVNVSGLIPGELAEIELRKGTENGVLLDHPLFRADANGRVSTSLPIDGRGSYTVIGWFGEQSLGDDREKRTEKLSVEVVMEVSYAHVAPGEYSEIYVDVSGLIPTSEEGYIALKKGTKSSPTIGSDVVHSDRHGRATTTFRINERGDYTVVGYFGDGSTAYARRETKIVTITVR